MLTLPTIFGVMQKYLNVGQSYFTYTSFTSVMPLLTHCGRMTQICVFTLQLCKTDDANLRF